MADSTLPNRSKAVDSKHQAETAENAAMFALLRRVAIITPLVILLAVGGLYGFLAQINSAALRAALIARATGIMGLRVRFESLSIQPFSSALELKGVGISAPEGFGDAPLFTAVSIVFDVDLPALILDGRLLLGSMVVTKAKINLVHRLNPQTGQEEWNTDRVLPPQPAKPVAPLKAFWVTEIRLPQDEVVFEGTRITVGTPDQIEPRSLRDTKLTLNHLSLTEPVSFAIAGRVGGGGRFHSEGVAGPWTRPSGTALPVKAGVTLEVLDLGPTGQRIAGDRIEGHLWFSGTVDLSATRTALKGQLRVNELKFGKQPRTSRIGISTNVQVTGASDTHLWTLDPCELHVGSSIATLNGTWTVEGDVPNVHLNFNSQRFAVSDATEFVAPPDVKSTQTNGLQDGRAIGSMTVEGPVTAPNIKGEASVFSRQITGIDLDASLGGSGVSTGATASTAVENLKFKFESAGESMSLPEVQLETPRYRMNGAGSVAPDGRLHFLMSAVPVRPGQAKASFSLDGSFAKPELQLGAK